MSSNLTLLFQHWADEDSSQIIQLQNKDKVPIAALYLDKLKLDELVICQTENISEKYYIYLDGIAIFFTYYNKYKKE